MNKQRPNLSKSKQRGLTITIAAAIIIALFSIYKLVIAGNKREIDEYIQQMKNRLAAKYSPENNEGVAYKQLANACSSRDLNSIRHTLIKWCDHYIEGRRVFSMEDILQQTESPDLHSHAQAIQTSPVPDRKNGQATDDSFDAKSLLQLVSQLRKSKQSVQKKQHKEDQYSLPPLYKT